MKQKKNLAPSTPILTCHLAVVDAGQADVRTHLAGAVAVALQGVTVGEAEVVAGLEYPVLLQHETKVMVRCIGAGTDWS